MFIVEFKSVLCKFFFLNVWVFKWVLLYCFGDLLSILVPIGIDMKCSGKSFVLYIVLNTWSCILLFKFVLWYTLYLFCVEFKIILYQFLYRCGHFNLSLIANQTISDSFLEMCSPVKFAHSLSKKSRTVSSWELCIIYQISCDDTLSKASEKEKCKSKLKIWKQLKHSSSTNKNLKAHIYIDVSKEKVWI